jgi:hypothetical protein
VQEEKNWQGVDICLIGNGALHLVLSGTGINIPIYGTILREKVKIIAAKLNIYCFSASSGWLS